MVDQPPSISRPLSSARHEAHTRESRSRVCAAFDVLTGQLSTPGRLCVLQVARHVQDRVIHASCHSRPSQCRTGAIAPTHERDMPEAKLVNPGDRPSSTAARAIARPQVRREAVRPRHAFNYCVLHWRFVGLEPYVLQGTFKLRCVLKPQQGRREGTRCRSDLIPPTKLKQGWDGLGPQIRVRVGTAMMSPASTQCGLRSGETRWGSGGHLPQQDVSSLNSVWVEVRRDALKRKRRA